MSAGNLTTRSHPITDVRGLRSRHLVIAVLGAWILLLLGCGKSDVTRLHNTFKSPKELVQRVLRSLEENDVVGLRALCLSRYEHDSVLVPAMGREHVDLDLAWFYLEANIEKGVAYAISAYGGRKLTLVSVEFREPQDDYGSLILHRSPQVTVRDQETDETIDLPIFGSIAEEQGRFKLVSIRD